MSGWTRARRQTRRFDPLLCALFLPRPVLHFSALRKPTQTRRCCGLTIDFIFFKARKDQLKKLLTVSVLRSTDGWTLTGDASWLDCDTWRCPCHFRPGHRLKVIACVCNTQRMLLLNPTPSVIHHPSLVRPDKGWTDGYQMSDPVTL